MLLAYEQLIMAQNVEPFILAVKKAMKNAKIMK